MRERRFPARKECVTISLTDKNPHHTTAKRTCGDGGNRILLKLHRKKLLKAHLHFTFRKSKFFSTSGTSAATLCSLGSDTVVKSL